LYAQNYDSNTFRRLLPGIEFETAISTIEIISAKTEDKQMYDQREKAQRDYEWAISGAREEGREESELIGKVHLLQELLGEAPTTKSMLLSEGIDALTQRLTNLQQRLRGRQA
jgi:hypothetical protein